MGSFMETTIVMILPENVELKKNRTDFVGKAGRLSKDPLKTAISWVPNRLFPSCVPSDSESSSMETCGESKSAMWSTLGELQSDVWSLKSEWNPESKRSIAILFVQAQTRFLENRRSVRLWYLQCVSNGDTTVLH